MKYLVDVNGRRHEVVTAESALADGETVSGLSFQPLGDGGGGLLRVGGRVVRAVVREGAGAGGASRKGHFTIWLDGERFEVVALDERSRAIEELTARMSPASVNVGVLAPMPGLVVQVHVAIGEVVEAGQRVVVIEAMKMENELRARVRSTVKAVHVTSGQAVEKGMLLVDLTAEPG